MSEMLAFGLAIYILVTIILLINKGITFIFRKVFKKSNHSHSMHLDDKKEVEQPTSLEKSQNSFFHRSTSDDQPIKRKITFKSMLS